MPKIYSFEQSLKELNKAIDDISQDIIKKARFGIQAVAAQTHGLVLEKASKLGSRRKQYLEAVNLEKVASDQNDEIWAVTLKKDAGWIEDGLPARNMLDNFLRSPKAKVNKKGQRYLTIPFKHNKSPGDMSAAQRKLARYVKSELKARGLDKVVNDELGKPKLGRVATVDLTGPKAPVSKHNTPILKGLTIYQKEVKTASGKTNIKRDIMTFRIASESQRSSGLWDYPPLKGANIFDEVAKEVDVLYTKMLNEVLGGKS